MRISGEVRLDASPGETSEAELIARAHQEDQIAWQLLVRQHEEQVFRLAYLVLRDAADAEDTAQEAFVRAYLSLDRFDISRPLRPWLLRITVNLARNRRRAMGRYLANLRRLLERSPEPILNSPPSGDIVHQRWQADRLWQAVQQLNQIGQEVVYLRYFLDLSEAEMAETLDVAPGTIKSRLHRAVKRLRDVIERDYPDLRETFGE